MLNDNLIARQIKSKLIQLSAQYPIISLTGPRQSGKSTLVRSLFAELPYVLLEDPDVRLLAEQDPRGFLANYPNGAVFDEVQRVPDLFSYLQGIVDQGNQQNPYILIGSQNFLLMEGISQSLAGRAAVLRLLPFNYAELQSAEAVPTSLETLLWQGSYPRLITRQLDPTDFYPAYIQTYLERDVRSLKNISDLGSFARFLRLCAGRAGNLLNLSSLANDSGISVNTAKSWLSVLEASYVVYMLEPFHENYSKRIVKSPKLFFYDTGLVCALLGLRRADLVETYYMRGSLFENWVVSEVVKHFYNQGQTAPIYFWQDKTGREVDLLIEQNGSLLSIEIKAGQTLNPTYFNQLTYWNKLSGNPASNSYVVYGGTVQQETSAGTFVPVSGLAELLGK
ncbi:ATP-binding protein [Fibrella aquatilis]|uniref:ATP-binding protein n=1 Tax=Fibrella aquatilis TaxID=2817059 RepID=A0A939G2R2_9BACT|nr:ATP-binding protein [Fibrella aquatilis]MBO0930005.1 ATP-binding protein [Fibrella aquatilis]